MIQKIVIFLVRKKLGLKKYEKFRFSTQRITNPDIYTFGKKALYKTNYNPWRISKLGLNYLLSDECKIIKVTEEK